VFFISIFLKDIDNIAQRLSGVQSQQRRNIKERRSPQRHLIGRRLKTAAPWAKLRTRGSRNAKSLGIGFERANNLRNYIVERHAQLIRGV